MARLIGPDQAERVYFYTSGSNKGQIVPAGTPVPLYADTQCTLPADVRSLDGSTIAGTIPTVLIGDTLEAPLFQFPDVPDPVVYTRILGGPVVALHPRTDDRIDALTARIGVLDDAVEELQDGVSEYVVDLRLRGVPYDGVTDGLAATQALIDAAPAGSVIEFAAGVLGVTGTLRLRPGLTYRAQSPAFGATVKLLAGGSGVKAVLASTGWVTPATAPIYTGDPIRVDGIRVDGNRANTAATSPDCHGIVVMNWQSTVTGCTVDNTSGDGIRLADRDTAGTLLSNTSVESRVTDNRVYGCGGDGIHVEDYAHSVTDGYCTDNIVGECDGHAIRVERGSGWKVTGNHTYAGIGHGLSAIWVSAGFETDLSDNYVDGLGQLAQDGLTHSAIRLDQLDASSSTVHRNRVAARSTPRAGCTYRYIDVQVGSGANGVISLHGNTVQGRSGANETGVFVYAPTGSTLLVDELGTSLSGITTGKRLESFGPVTVASATLGAFAVGGAITAGSGLGGTTTGQRINLADAGVPYDGVTDGLAAAQAIIDGAADGTLIEFSPGVLAVSGTLKLKPRLSYRTHAPAFRSSVKLMNASSGVLAVMASTGWVTPGTAPISTGDPIHIEGIRVDGNKANNGLSSPTCHGIVVMNWQSTVTGCLVDNTTGAGIVFTDRDTANQTLSNTSVECRITNNRVSGCDGDGILVEDYAGRITDGYCTDNLVAAANGHAIRIQRGAGWLVQGNHVYTGSSRGAMGIWVSAGFATDVSHNYIDYYGQTGTGQFYSGVRLDIGGGTGRGCTMHGNRIAAPANLVAGNTYRHLAVTAASTAVSAVSIKGNLILGQGGSNETGIHLSVTAGGVVTVDEAGNDIQGVPGNQLLVRSGTMTLGTITRGTHTVGGDLTAQSLAPTGLTGATAASRYVGATTSGAPVTGTFTTGDWVTGQDGTRWTCTAGGSPGTWVQAGSTSTATPRQRTMLGTDMIPNTTGTQLYSHNVGSGVGGMLSDGGRVTGMGLRTVYDAHELVAVFGNFMTQQVQPSELVPTNDIRVSAAVVFPWGNAIRYTTSSPTYSAGTTYAAGDMVVQSGAWYLSLQSTNTNHTPSTAGNESWWQLAQTVPLFRQGRRTFDIAPGAYTLTDQVGISVTAATRIGLVATVEPLTRAGVPVGSVTASVAYNSGTTYAAGDIVVSGSRYYESLQDSNTNHTPPTAGDTWWGPIVYPYGLTAYPQATTQPDFLYITAAAAGGGRPTDYTQAPPTTQGSTSAAAGYGPIAVLMRPKQQAGTVPVIAGVGDSIFNGSSDGNLFVNEPGGYFSRAINGAHAHVRINKAGDALRYWFTLAGAPRQGRSTSLALLDGCTHAVLEHGTNDITSAGSLAQMQTYMIAMWRYQRDRGIQAFQCTVTPQTDTTDAYATLANQTARSGFGLASTWSTLNAWLVAGAPVDPTTLAAVAIGTSGAALAKVWNGTTFAGGFGTTHPLYGVVDTAAVVTDAATGKWVANYTADGTHPNSTSYPLLAAALPIAAIAAVPALTV